MPIETVVYKCSLCHDQFGSMPEAVDCEERHRIPQSIANTAYASWESEALPYDAVQYPLWVQVQFDDGSIAGYKFNRRIQ